MGDLSRVGRASLRPTLAKKLDAACDAFEAAWQSGGRPQLEEYLRDVSADDSAEFLRELLSLELAYRRRQGETPRRDEYDRRFPDQQNVIEQVFAESESQQNSQAESTGPGEQPSHSGSGRPVKKWELPAVPGCEVQEEIGRGGMGAVLRVRDPVFDRPLAVKVMLPETLDEPDAEQRFLEEAKLTGQLQHPGIPPVHDLGVLPDGRPYFTMKLIKGKTLSELLKVREANKGAGKNESAGGDALPRFLAIFEQVCQTMGYAHSHGVIHRDLKPANVMVGAFGEVQVMDWGLAKQIGNRESGIGNRECKPEAPAQDEPAAPERTHAGDVMGTLSYMAPEQARGEVANLDERCDVFGLGAILCRILTGKPAFRSGTSKQVLERSRTGDLDDAYQRLDACGADVELIELAKTCLAPNKDLRPRNAREVADAIAEYQSHVQERLRRAQLETAAVQARAQEQRKRQRVIVLASMAVLLLLIALSGTYLWYQSDRSRRRDAAEQAIQTSLRESQTTRDKLHTDLKRKGGVFHLMNDLSAWKERITKAKEALARAMTLQRQEQGNIDEGLSRQIQPLDANVQQDEADLNLAVQLEKIRLNKSFITRPSVRTAEMSLKKKNQPGPLFAPEEDYHFDKTSAHYLSAFKNAGFILSAQKDNSVAERIKRSAIWEQLVVVLDDWAAVAYRAGNRKLHRRLLSIARLVDSSSWSQQIRDAAVWDDPKALKKLVETAPMDRRSPQTWLLVGGLLRSHKMDAEDWFRRAQRLFPQDFWINMLLGNALIRTKPRDAVGFYHAAAAIRPRSIVYNNLGNALHRTGNAREAFLAYKKAFTLDPKNSYASFHLGQMHNEKNDYRMAIDFFKKTLKLDPSAYKAHNDLGHVYSVMGKRYEALASFRMATKLKPNFATGWYNLGNELRVAEKLPDAVRAYQTAIRHSPNDADTHNNLGVTLAQLKNIAKAIVHFRQAIALDKDYLFPRLGLAKALMEQGNYAEAVPVWEQALSRMHEKHPLKGAVQKLLNECKKKSKQINQR